MQGNSFQIPRAFQKSDSINLLLCVLTALIQGKHVAHVISEFCRLRDNSEERLLNGSLSTEELGIEFSLRSTGGVGSPVRPGDSTRGLWEVKWVGAMKWGGKNGSQSLLTFLPFMGEEPY